MNRLAPAKIPYVRTTGVTAESEVKLIIVTSRRSWRVSIPMMRYLRVGLGAVPPGAETRPIIARVSAALNRRPGFSLTGPAGCLTPCRPEGLQLHRPRSPGVCPEPVLSPAEGPVEGCA